MRLPTRFRWWMWDQLTGLGDWFSSIKLVINDDLYYPLGIPSNICWWLADNFFDSTDDELHQLDLEDIRRNGSS